MGEERDDTAVPGLDTGPEGRPGPVLLTVEVDGETFAVRRGHDGGTQYDWVSGPNDGYGFGCSAPPPLDAEAHVEGLRAFLGMIDPATGYIAED